MLEVVPMLACVDVQYEGDSAVAACLAFRAWRDAAPAASYVERIAAVAPYEPGAFYRRELPCILQVLARVPPPVDLVVVDGYVWLDAAGAPGLGAHLYRALEEGVAVVGVAKTAFRGSAHAEAVLRGTSKNPLYVTAAGIDLAEAARSVARMHGGHRVPTLLKQVDALCRAGWTTRTA